MHLHVWDRMLKTLEDIGAMDDVFRGLPLPAPYGEIHAENGQSNANNSGDVPPVLRPPCHIHYLVAVVIARISLRGHCRAHWGHPGFSWAKRILHDPGLLVTGCLNRTGSDLCAMRPCGSYTVLFGHTPITVRGGSLAASSATRQEYEPGFLASCRSARRPILDREPRHCQQVAVDVRHPHAHEPRYGRD
jgi:hypothetical protein